MKDKTKKKIMIGTIITLTIAVIVLLILLLNNNGSSLPLSVAGSGISCPTVNSNQVNGQCSDGGTYTCTTTCTNRPPITPTAPKTPGNQNDCSKYASENGYTHYSYMTSFTSDESCRSYASSLSTTYQCYPTKLKLIGNCCLWSC